MRSDVGATLLRAKGSSYQLRDNQTISNLYSLELVNKSASAMPFRLVPEDKKLKIQVVNPINSLAKGGTASLSFFLIIDNADVKKYKEDVKIAIYSGDRKVETLKTTFIAPPGM
ncbi:Ubp3 associated protein Bre5 [compost metagenome]